ncbi:MAG TPA: hypothetical protein VFY73_25475 [Ideonella sp.]|uniref:hypothetical protein n=1 Tax=Ideonella sp. TaxID=1929293 RepID=UPI002E339EDA|nr:hypothetical protein [Ideonella sp.]HEX5687381.1 hypothetical protein [Ideonella sp.]
MNEFETFLKIVALLAGAAFFGWKIFTGWLIINLKMSVCLSRERRDDETDFLAIVVTLEKGATDSIWLQHITARAKSTDGNELAELDLSDELKWLQVVNKRVILMVERSHFPQVRLCKSPASSKCRAEFQSLSM